MEKSRFLRYTECETKRSESDKTLVVAGLNGTQHIVHFSGCSDIVAESARVEKDDEILGGLGRKKRIIFEGSLSDEACVDGKDLGVRFFASNGSQWVAKEKGKTFNEKWMPWKWFKICAEFSPEAHYGTCAITYAQLEWKGRAVSGAVVNFGRRGTEELEADDLAIIPNYTLEKGEEVYYLRERNRDMYGQRYGIRC